MCEEACIGQATAVWAMDIFKGRAIWTSSAIDFEKIGPAADLLHDELCGYITYSHC